MNHNMFAAVVATMLGLIVIVTICIGVHCSPPRTLPRRPNSYAGVDDPNHSAEQRIPSAFVRPRPVFDAGACNRWPR